MNQAINTTTPAPSAPLTASQIAQANPPGAHKVCIRTPEFLKDLAEQIEEGVLLALNDPTPAGFRLLSQVAHNIKADADSNFVWVNADGTPATK